MPGKLYEGQFRIAVAAGFFCGLIALCVALANFKSMVSGGDHAGYLAAGGLSFGLAAIALSRRS